MFKVRWKLVFSFWATIFIPSLYLLNIYIAAVTPNSFFAPLEAKIMGLFLSIFGVIFWVVSYINLGHSFGVLPQKQKKIKRGLYKYFNHPMYIGIYATFAGLSVANASWQGLVFLNLVVLPLLFIRGILEERKLHN